jgi:acetyltransferase-like isoleucine patch superfamily enzyme
VFITVNDSDKPAAAVLAARFHALGFKRVRHAGTAAFLEAQGMPVTRVLKVNEGRPHGMDLIVNGEVQLLVNTPLGKHAQQDDERCAGGDRQRVPYTTTLSAANAACDAIAAALARSRRAVAAGVARAHSRRPGAGYDRVHRRGGGGRRVNAARRVRRRRRWSRAPIRSSWAHRVRGTSRVARRSRPVRCARVRVRGRRRRIGAGTRVWHFCARDGRRRDRCALLAGQNVVVMNGVRVGDNCKIQNNVSLYEGVELEDDVFCGPSMVFTNVLNPRSAVSRKDEYRRHAGGQGATIGANATIVCGVTLGAYAFVGAGAVVTRTCPPTRS